MKMKKNTEIRMRNREEELDGKEEEEKKIEEQD